MIVWRGRVTESPATLAAACPPSLSLIREGDRMLIVPREPSWPPIQSKTNFQSDIQQRHAVECEIEGGFASIRVNGVPQIAFQAGLSATFGIAAAFGTLKVLPQSTAATLVFGPISVALLSLFIAIVWRWPRDVRKSVREIRHLLSS